jgi:hypothetical protein
MFPDTCLYERFFLFWYVELVSEVCLHFLVTPYACVCGDGKFKEFS